MWSQDHGEERLPGHGLAPHHLVLAHVGSYAGFKALVFVAAASPSSSSTQSSFYQFTLKKGEASQSGLLRPPK
jgi:hypothetical protein